MFNDNPLIELDQGLARPQMASFRKTPLLRVAPGWGGLAAGTRPRGQTDHIYAANSFGGVGKPLNHFHATRLLGKRMIQMVAMMIRK